MRRLLLIAAVLGLGWGCQQDEALRGELTEAAQEVFSAMARGDSVATATLVHDSIALSRMWLLAEREPGLLQSLSSQPEEVQDLWSRGDTAGVSLTVSGTLGVETLQMTFIHDGAKWRLLYLTLPDRG